MNKKDTKLIEQFVKKTKDLPQLECIILFGSMARDETDKRSDIDILLIFNEEKPKSHIPEIIHSITSLQPHREIKPTVTNLTDYDEEFLKNVIREGKVLWGKIIITTDHLLLKPYRLVTYDISTLKPSKKVKISRFIHGYQSKKTIKGNIKQYTYKGLKDFYDAYLISKNTVLVPEKYAKKFLHELDAQHVSYQERMVWT